MAPKQIRVTFQPLLRHITECLQFPLPVYDFLDISKNNVCVAVRTESGPIAYVYIGGEASTLEESCDRDAEKAVRSLMRKYDVIVEDFTSSMNKELEICSRLYHLKRVELEAIEKGQPQVLSRNISV